MKCQLSKRHELIANYLTHELSEKEVAEFEEHYLQCDICFKELKVAEDAINLINREGTEILTTPETLPVKKPAIRQKWQPRWGFALSAAGAVSAISLIVLISLNNEKGLDLSGPSFIPEPYLEEWVLQSTRAGDEIIEAVLSPAIGEKLDSREIIFRWTMVENVAVSMKILSNLEAETLTATPDVAHFPQFTIKVDAEVFKEPGLYYWRIEDEQNVFYVGKFYFLGNDL